VMAWTASNASGPLQSHCGAAMISGGASTGRLLRGQRG